MKLFLSVVLLLFTTALSISPSSVEEGKVVNGDRLDVDRRRFQVALVISSSYLCGGSLIAPNVVLTAAHCVKGFSKSQVVVRAGSKFYDRGGVRATVERIVIHERFDSSTMDNDVALVVLSADLKLGPRIGLVQLAKRVPRHGQTVFVSGFGRTSVDGDLSPQLMSAKLSFVSMRECYKKLKGNVSKWMLCAGDEKRDSCKGDSGGPLTWSGKLLGVVSWGYGCADPRYPAVYASVPALRKWIVAHARKYCKGTCSIR